MSDKQSIEMQLAKYQQLGEDICSAMREELTKSGINTDFLSEAMVERASFSLKEDPFTKQDTLEGEWRDTRGQKTGEILFHGDGSFYAEYDVIQPHPRKSDWFIESVTAWGRDSTIKTEVKLLPAV